MTDDTIFNATIEPIGEFQVGNADGKGSSFRLVIKYPVNKSLKLEDCAFRLGVVVNSMPEALVLNKEAAENIECRILKDYDITIDSYLQEKKFYWKISSYDDAPFVPGKPIKVIFSKIISETESGKVSFTFEAEVSGKEVPTQLTGELEKCSSQPGIIYFYSTTEARAKDANTPESIAPAAEQIFPGEKVILKWCTHRLRPETLKIKKDGRPLSGIDFKTDKGEKELDDIRESTEYVLSGKFRDESGQGTAKAKVRVDVLSTGWHTLTKTVDSVELEPSLLFNANDQTIYALFRKIPRNKILDNKEESILFQTGNPFWDWTSIKSSVPGGFATSPGVYCDDKLWIIGGSQIDPDITSNKVWYFDPNKKTRGWREVKPGDKQKHWRERMGHVCLYIPPGFDNDNNQDQIWVMGGCDQNGNTLDDVWSYDVSNKKWTERPELKLPNRGCMFSCAMFDNKIWLYGGLKNNPLSDQLMQDIFVSDGEKWEKNKEDQNPSFNGGEPMSASLQFFGKKLHIIGKTQKEGVIKAFHYLLKEPSTMTWEQLPCDKLQGWGEDMSLSYQLINFQDKLLIAKALGYEEANPLLKIYVPELHDD